MGRSVPGIEDAEFSASFELLELRLTGNAEKSVAQRLDQMVKQVHALVVGTAHQVHIDWRALEFLSASCLNVFVGWAATVAELPPEERYRLRFRTNPSLSWQQRSLMMLARVAPAVVVIDIEQ